MKAVFKRNDLIRALALFVSGIFARNLNSALVCLSTRIAEKDLFKPRSAAKLCRKLMYCLFISVGFRLSFVSV